jgi:serine/threonine-protein kinase
VKPDNIFLVGEADAPREVRLVDFGLAKLHGNKRRASKPGITLGTAAYMPPEQVLSEKVDARADVYSLGVVMFRALTGHLPFEGENDLDMLSHQVLLQAPPPSWFFDHLYTSVDTIVQHAMCKHPDNRYQDMACFARDIEKLIAKEEISPKNKVQRDAYRPSTPLGMETALLFCQKLGITPPWNE